MDFETAFSHIDAAVFEHCDRHLSSPEATLLKGTWQGMTYEQMAQTSEYSLNYLMRDIGPKFWKLLSAILGEEVSKTNLRVVLQQQASLPSDSLPSMTGKRDQGHIPPTDKDPDGWEPQRQGQTISGPVGGEIPTVASLYGYGAELSQLQQWVVEAGCRLIAVQGLPGMGKTALVSTWVHQVQDRFDVVIWRSLSQAPPLSKLLADLLQILSPQSNGDRSQLSQLMIGLQQTRCCLILDDVDAIFQPLQLYGQLRPGYEGYSEFFQRMGDTAHQSCLLMLGLEPPRDLMRWADTPATVRSLSLSGIEDAAACTLLQAAGLTPTDALLPLARQYQGHPAALMLAAKLIRTVFNGNVAEFLNRKTTLFGALRDLLASTLRRLSEIEKEVLYRLAIERNPLSFSDLETHLYPPVPEAELIEVLASLKQRSLLHTTDVEGQSVFALQPLMLESVTHQLVAQIQGPSPMDTPVPPVETVLDLTSTSPSPVHLTPWLQDQSEPEWQSLVALLGNRAKLSLRLRSISHLRQADAVKRFKPLHLGKPDTSEILGLVVAIAPAADEKIGIRIQVQPLGERSTLPSHLRLSLINEAGETLRTVQSRQQDSFMQLPYFRGKPQEQFSIRLDLNQDSLTETFLI